MTKTPRSDRSVRIFGFAGSTYVRTARMTGIEKGAAHELAPLDFRGESHRALHPFLKMPVMQVDDVTLHETLAITTYLDETRSGPRLAPASALGRARMSEAISAACDYVYRDVVGALVHVEGAPSDAVLETARATLAPFEARLADEPFLAGDALSLADLFLFPMVDFAAARAPSLLDSLPRLAAWRDRIGERESAKATRS